VRYLRKELNLGIVGFFLAAQFHILNPAGLFLAAYLQIGVDSECRGSGQKQDIETYRRYTPIPRLVDFQPDGAVVHAHVAVRIDCSQQECVFPGLEVRERD